MTNRMNIFEGSRRIALLLKLLYLVAVVAITATTKPTVHRNFVTTGPSDEFRGTPDSCRIGTDASEFKTQDIGDGKTVYLHLCFRAQRGDDGREVVPYTVDGTGRWLGNHTYNNLVMTYTKAREERFKLSREDFQAAHEAYDQQRLENIRTGFFFAVGGWIGFTVVQFVIGWIVRGFAGIPLRQDRRPDAQAIKTERPDVEEVG